MESLPDMGFADELFCEGKVLPPLKLPPRLRYPNDTVSSNPTSPMSSFTSIIKFWSLWNGDFDPFMVAMENVKEEKRGKMVKKSYERAQSMSPTLPTTPEQPNGPVFELKLAEPKGVVYARQARRLLAKVEAEERPTVEGGKLSRKKKIMKLTKRSLSMAETSDEKKNAAAKSMKSKPSKQFSFESMGLELEYNQAKRVSDNVTRMAIVQWRPKVFLCMGFAPKYEN
ncbi:hypothetical protein HS088_TW02G00639 [Tripterygium wilfordii]|uniref:Uncharacterized protein n=1 Tax=Tripterygium wilfordii TaxID=458696 RepID=A0A7J7DZJ8_TRIWF|nr:hypothetical protein HS088_TW02G00639 [Tripterygium wilfordii]